LGASIVLVIPSIYLYDFKIYLEFNIYLLITMLLKPNPEVKNKV